MAKSARLVFTTDWHFQKLARFFPDHIERQVKELTKPFEYAIKHGIKTVLVGGDISEDPHLTAKAEAALFQLLSKYDQRLNTHIILGNHDFASTEAHSLQPLTILCKERRFKTVHVYEHPTHVKIDGINFNMLPFPYTHENKVWTKTPSVNLAHLEWKGAVRDNGKSVIRDGYDDGQEGRDIWLIGHLHTAQYIESSRVLYVGTQYQTNFGETEDKSFCDVEIKCKSSGSLALKFERIPQRCHFRLINLRVNELKDLTKLNKSPDYQYKLWVGEGIKIPPTLLSDYPNIVAITGTKMEQPTADLTTVANNRIELTTGLADALRQRGLKRKQIARARQLLNKIAKPILAAAEE